MWNEILLRLPRLWARPLYRLGEYEIDEQLGSNPLPDRGLSKRALTVYWRDLLREHTDIRIARDRPCGKDCNVASHSEWRHSSKIEMKTYEAIIRLLHDIIAPDAAFLCDRGCRHVKRGMTPKQLKRFLDSLDAFLADADSRVKKGGGIYPEYVQDLMSESSEVRQWRDEIWKAWQKSSGPLGGTPAGYSDGDSSHEEITSKATNVAESNPSEKPEPVALWIGKVKVLTKGEKVSEQELQDRIDKALAELNL